MLSSLIMGLAVWGVLRLTSGLYGVMLAVGTGVIVYGSSILVLDRAYLFQEIRSIKKHLIK